MQDAPDPDYIRHHIAVAEALGAELRIVRLERRLSQEQVAFSAGIAVPTYGNLERCRPWSVRLNNPSLGTLLRVFRALGVAPPSIIDR